MELLQADEGGDHGEALRQMMDRSFCHGERYSEQQGRADRRYAPECLLEFERKLIDRFRKVGVPLFTHCLYRGADEQSELHRLGRSKARAGQSPHNYSCAVDIIHGTKGWNLTRKQWALIGHYGKEVAKTIRIPDGVRVVKQADGTEKEVLKTRPFNVVWGGDWKFYDPAHWEWEEWRDVKDLADENPNFFPE